MTRRHTFQRERSSTTTDRVIAFSHKGNLSDLINSKRRGVRGCSVHFLFAMVSLGSACA